MALPAAAETWMAQSSLLANESPGSCTQYRNVTYKLEYLDGVITGTTDSGRLFSATVAADGAVKHEFKSPTTARLEISGNARTRDLLLYNLNSGCRWRLVARGQ